MRSASSRVKRSSIFLFKNSCTLRLNGSRQSAPRLKFVHRRGRRGTQRIINTVLPLRTSATSAVDCVNRRCSDLVLGLFLQTKNDTPPEVIGAVILADLARIGADAATRPDEAARDMIHTGG